MTLDDYMLNVFCLVDDQMTALHLDHVRRAAASAATAARQ